MKKILILFLFVSQLLYGQKLTREKIYQKIKENSSNTHIEFYSPEGNRSREFYSIGLITKGWITEPSDYDRYKNKPLMTEWITDSTVLKKIIEIFDSKGFLEKIYVRIDSAYVNVENTQESYKEKELKLIVDLFCPAEKGYFQIFIPIREEETAKDLIETVSKIFDRKEQKIFEELLDNVK